MAETPTETLDSSPQAPQISEDATKDNEDQLMTDAPNSNKVPRSDSDTESDSDDDDDAKQNLEIQALETELSSNPSNYDAHVQYIKSLRKQGDIEKLRIAREAMSTMFPLSSEMWKEWIKDEMSLSSGPEAFPAIEKLYERGVSDYLSVVLWCDYLNYVQEHDPSVSSCSIDGISKARNLFERALTAAGLHVAEGGQIWELYRDFEQAILITIDGTDHETREKQIQRIRNLFHRQLSVPLADLKTTLIAYKAWEVEQGGNIDVNSSNLDGISAQVVSAYQKALEMLNARLDLEDLISNKDATETDRLQQFMTYLKFEQSSGDPARVQILYERAVADFPISSDLWLDYTLYMGKTLKTSRIVRDIHHRATRNCPWSGELWTRYLLCLERSRASEDELSTVFEKSLQCTFLSIEEYLEVFLTRVDSLRRRMSSSQGVGSGLDYAMIRDTFQRASDYLSPHLKNTEKLIRMYSYWAHLEANLRKDLIAARGVWESLLKICGSMLEAWQGYISMEIKMGHINEARSLYKRCYSKKFPGTGSEDICHSWVRFERECGSLEDFDLAVQKVTPRLEELRLFRLQQESKNTGLSADQREIATGRGIHEKRKPLSDVADEQPAAKRRKEKAKNSKSTDEKGKTQATDLVGAGKMDVVVEASKPASASKKEKEDISTGKPKQYNDQCTAFISNLSFQANYDDLQKFFSDVGGVVAIRILTDKFTGKSRGLAYVDFCDDAHLAAALAKNRQKLHGKKLSILRSDPQQNRKRGNLGKGMPTKHADSGGQGSKSDSKDSGEISRQSGGGPKRDQSVDRQKDDIQLKGRNIFAMPRAVSKSKPKLEQIAEEGGDENPKSNDEFRKMFLKS
ncbi:squamous cell carcinoma antigen recognized by T-cells 3 isoform X1 [Ipomoea triloba]|uniref:squamous cell carcinoma antigen recognized by T-cells 3 isoform X1 n=2 Tax=Ipomoea triloba TaxID=35885 RepID=UPI00125D3876|nr:squamous cell carcinoma antigen recognized by T-cells 3 isoform X1 [Ipomoea triloba]